jgi:hypothetical protein
MTKHLFLFITLLLLKQSSYGQIEPMIKWYSEKQVQNKFHRLAKANKNDEGGYKLSDYKNGDTLILKVEGYENIIMKFTFGLDRGYCNYQSIEFSCDSCSLKHTEETLDLKYCGWKKLGADKYLSKYAVQTEMEIKTNDFLCRKIIYRYVDKPKKEYKTEYDSLKNSRDSAVIN